MCLTQKFSFSADPVILDLKLQLAKKVEKNVFLGLKSEEKTLKKNFLQGVPRINGQEKN